MKPWHTFAGRLFGQASSSFKPAMVLCTAALILTSCQLQDSDPNNLGTAPSSEQPAVHSSAGPEVGMETGKPSAVSSDPKATAQPGEDSGGGGISAPDQAGPGEPSIQHPEDAAPPIPPVQIVLDKEPTLHSPAEQGDITFATLVSYAPQEYTFTFREPMNHESTEQKLTAQTRPNNGQSVPLKLTFVWESDIILKVKAVVSAAPSSDYPLREYILNATGAETAKGERLLDAATFRAVLFEPNQVWKISLSGKTPEQLSALKDPYQLNPLDEKGRYLLATRYTQYCECDASFPMLYGVLDTEKKEFVKSPVPLYSSYEGPGQFVADSRGFVYPAASEDQTPLPGGHSYPIHLDDYVFGTGFSRDMQYLFAITGGKDQTQDFNLVIVHLPTGKTNRLEQALRGSLPEIAVSGTTLPVSFYDGGGQVTFVLNDPDTQQEIRYSYSMKDGQVKEWIPPTGDSWSGYSSSDDGVFRLYANAGLFRGADKISGGENLKYFGGLWARGTHQYYYLSYDPEASDPEQNGTRLHRYNGDNGKDEILLNKLPINVNLLGVSPDQQSVYLSAPTGIIPGK